MKKLILAAVAASAFATPAFADSTDEIDVGGNVPVECYIDGLPESVSFGNLSRRGAAAAVSFNGIEVFCNQRSKVSITSDEGFLRAVTNNSANNTTNETTFASGANPGFAAGLDYLVRIPNVDPFGGPFEADTSQITAGDTVDLGGGSVGNGLPALNDPNVRIVFDTIAGSLPLLGTTYNDELTISISANGV